MSATKMGEEKFREFSQILFDELPQNEALSMDLMAEESQFIRFNRAKIRQLGTVNDASVCFKLLLKSGTSETDLRQAQSTISLTGDLRGDLARAAHALTDLRQELPALPPDPYSQLPKNHGSSSKTWKGKLPSPEISMEMILPVVQGLDFTGIYAAGRMIRANANSAGQSHWFETESYTLDFSLITSSERSMKCELAGREWDSQAFFEEIQFAREKLEALERAPKKVPRGSYRTYLAPAAVADLVRMLSWGGVSEASIRQGDSPLRHLRSGEKSFSPLFHLVEDFSSGDVPRFNDDGEISPERVSLIRSGRLDQTLVNSRTAKEYGVKANGANSGESLRSPLVSPGALSNSEVLKLLGTGLYLSNLHYLNWSDQPGGRITGMTRYACFWVEDGKIVAPIENLRFDDSLFNLFGSELEGFTDTLSVIPETSTYEFRQIGSARVPGMLVKKMEFTL